MRQEAYARGASLGRRLAASAPGRLLTNLAREIAKDDVFGMAAEMAYRFLFAIFPLLLLLTSSLGFLGDALGIDDLFARVLAEVQPVLPPDVYALVEGYVAGLLTTRSAGFLTVGILGTLWGASGGIGTLIKGLDRAYDVPQSRPFWKQQLLALAVTLVLPPAGLALLALTVLGGVLARWLGEGLGLAGLAAAVAALTRWPVLAFILMFALSLMYYLLPNTRRPYLWSLPGAAVATVGWLLLSELFGLYVANFGNFDATYGSFGAIIAFLLWLYLVGVVILVGAEVNEVLEMAYGSPPRAGPEAASHDAASSATSA